MEKAFSCQKKRNFILQQLERLTEHLVLDATGNRTMQLAIFVGSKHEEILSIISTGSEAIYKPLSYVRFLNLYTSEDKLIQMEVARSYYTHDQLTNLNTYILNTYRKELFDYNFSQRMTIIENISRHLCYMNINEFKT